MPFYSGPGFFFCSTNNRVIVFPLIVDFAKLLLKVILSFFMLPITGVYIFGLMAALGMLIYGDDVYVFLWVLFVAVSGYCLFSLWWLIFKFDKVSLNNISNVIKCGLIAGAALNVSLLYWVYLNYDASSKQNNSYMYAMIPISIPPLTILLGLLVTIVKRR